MVWIEATNVGIGGNIGANGGGGGEGGIRLGASPVTGDFGDDGAISANPAAGGSGTQFAGDGGDGSSRANASGGDGLPADGGGGGGGGGAGYILLRGNVTLGGNTSPVAIVE